MTQVHEIDLFCPDCGYNLRGTDGARCPECGTTYRFEQLATSRIPFTYCRTPGAFVRTILIATFRPSRLALCFNDGITWRRGRVLRWICVVLLAVPLLLLALATPGWETLALAPGLSIFGTGNNAAGNISSWLTQLGVPWYIAMQRWPIVTITIIGLGLALSKLPVRILSFAKLPEDRRTAILSAAQYLTGAAVGGALLGALLAAGAWLYLGTLQEHTPKLLAQTMAITVPLITFVAWLVALHQFYAQVGRTTGARLPPLTLLLPPLLLLTLVAWLLFLPAIAGLFVMIFDTLR